VPVSIKLMTSHHMALLEAAAARLGLKVGNA
jgi:hypothetical protein